MLASLKLTDVSPGSASSEAEPPQFDNDADTGFASTTLSGNSSVSDASVKVNSGSLFLMRIVNWLVCPTRMVFGVNDLLSVGASTTSTWRVALAGVVFVTGPWLPVDDSAPVGSVLIKLPGVNDVTSTETVHEPGSAPTCLGTVPPLNDRVVPPGTAPTVPPHVFSTLAGLAMNMPG